MDTMRSEGHLIQRAIGTLLVFAVMVCPIGTLAQQWAQGGAPYNRHINGCAVLEDGRMVVVGGHPVNDAIRSVYTSTSSGLDWSINHDVMGPWLWSVDFQGSQTGVAVGNDGAVVRTQNGGVQWEPQASGTDRHLRGVAFRDAVTVFAVGGQAGATPLRTIVRSDDGGVSWATVMEEAGPMLMAITFTDTQNGVAVGTAGTVLRTVNGGADWTSVATPALRDLNAVTFTDGSSGFAVGGRAANDSIRTIWNTADGGASWQVVMDIPGGWLRDIDFVDATTGYAVGAQSTVLMTTDGGANWSPVQVPNPSATVSFNAVSASAADLVLVAGQFGSVRVLHNISAPVAETLSPVVTSTTGAMLRGSLLSGHGGTYSFLFGTQPDLSDGGQTFPVPFSGSGTEQPMAFNIPNLTPDATYYYAAQATTLGGVSTGEILPLTMTLPPPMAITGHAVVETLNGVMLTGTVNTMGLEGEASFIYSSDPQLADGTVTPAMMVFTEYGQYVQTWVQMPPGEAMYYSLRVTTSTGTAYGDTVSLSADFPVVHLDSVTGTTSGNVVFHGRVEGLEGSANVHFSYGQQPDAPVEVSTIPGWVDGNGPHLITGAVPTALPQGNYQVRINVVTGLHTYVSNPHSFFVGVLFTEFSVTDVQYDAFSEIATFQGIVSGLAFPATLYFTYSGGGNSGQVGANPGTVGDNGTYELSAEVPLPADNTVYWVNLMAQMPSEWLYSGHVLLTTEMLNVDLTILTADSITPVSAVIGGHVGEVAHEVSVRFELGVTPQLGTVVEAMPGTVAAYSPTTVSASVDGLGPDTYYYYCLVAEVGSFVFRTDTRQFYTGEPPIPNWDFSEWEQRTVELPLGWNVLESDFERVSLGGGNSALRLQGYNAALIGTFRNTDSGGGENLPDFNGTVALNYRPDNVHIILDRHIEPGEVAYLILRLDSADVLLHFDFHPITGSTGGTFEELVIPITYDSPGTPDTVMIGLVSFDVLSANDDPGMGVNHLTVDRIHFGPSAPNVLHTAIDDWYSYTFNEVQGWAYPKLLGITSEDGQQVVEPYPYANGTDTAIILRNHLALVFNEEGWMQTGTSSMVIDDQSQYFNVNRLHEVLTGYYMFMPQGMDTLEIGVSFMLGDEPAGWGHFRTAEPASEMTRIEIPIYGGGMGATTADRASISIRIINASGGHPESVAVIDKLCFDGFYMGPQGTDSVPDGLREIPPVSMKVYPNPADGLVRVEWDAAASPTVLRVSDMHGRTVEEFSLAAHHRFIAVDTGKYPKGLYIVSLKSEMSSITKRLIVIR